MLKEIHEQPRAVEDTLRGRVDLVAGDVVGAEMGLSEIAIGSIDRVYFVACGTSAHAAMTGRYWIEQLARLPAVVEVGSEVRNRNPVLGPRDLVIAISQSGETLDTLAAVKTAKPPVPTSSPWSTSSTVLSLVRVAARFTPTQDPRLGLRRPSVLRRSS